MGLNNDSPVLKKAAYRKTLKVNNFFLLMPSAVVEYFKAPGLIEVV